MKTDNKKFEKLLQFFEENGTDTKEAINLPLEPGIEEDTIWHGCTIDVILASKFREIGFAYYHKKKEKWFIKGLAPFDIPMKEGDEEWEEFVAINKFLKIDQLNDLLTLLEDEKGEDTNKKNSKHTSNKHTGH